MNIVKLLGLVSMFKDVTKEVQAAGAEKRPWYLQRSAWGAIVSALGAVVALVFGVNVDTATLDSISDSIPQAIGVGVTLYGSILSVYGLIMKGRKSQDEGK